MKRKGWFELFKASVGNKPAIYQMSDKAKLIVADIYRKLNGEELPMHNKRNPMLKRSAKYSEKIYIDMIVEMNSFIQQQRRRPLE
jgi:hypothetical protein